ncbi:hypothetical protein NKH18_45200 [Streptomyces sp. M10(2022)]
MTGGLPDYTGTKEWQRSTGSAAGLGLDSLHYSVPGLAAFEIPVVHTMTMAGDTGKGPAPTFAPKTGRCPSPCP